MKLIIGLGNPGEKYTKTRHNIGFLLLDELQSFFNFPEFTLKEKFFAEVTSGVSPSVISTEALQRHGFSSGIPQKLLLAKPQTFMNLSGKSALALSQFYDIPKEHILIIHDDIDLPFGTIKYTEKSGSAGHNGVKDIFRVFDTQEISRIRVGVGPRPEYIPTEDFVLQNFSPEEVGKIPSEIFPEAQKHLQTFFKK